MYCIPGWETHLYLLVSIERHDYLRNKSMSNIFIHIEAFYDTLTLFHQPKEVTIEYKQTGLIRGGQNKWDMGGGYVGGYV